MKKIKTLLAALVLTGSVLVTASPAQAATAITTPDESTWCKVYFGGSNASAAPMDFYNPYSWRCLAPRPGGGWNWTNVGIDMNKACWYSFWKLGHSDWKGDARLVAPYDAWSWYCFH